jgi:hypothetical protein
MVKLHRSKAAVAFATVVVGLTVTPLAASGAAGKGSNPNSAFCKLEKASLAISSPTGAKEVALTKALEAGNWKVAKKNLLALEGQTGKLIQELTSALSSAPAKVKAAAQQSIKLVPAEIAAVRNSTSVAQYTVAIQKATNGAKFQKAADTIAGYDASQCGTD